MFVNYEKLLNVLNNRNVELVEFLSELGLENCKECILNNELLTSNIYKKMSDYLNVSLTDLIEIR